VTPTLARGAGFSPRSVRVQFLPRAYVSDFPPYLDIYIVSDAFLHYDLGFDDTYSTVYIYCERCDDIVGSVEYSDVFGLDRDELFELLVEEHERI
jgi:hypothetical protein